MKPTCPRDGIVLDRVKKGKQTIFHCSRCRGIWLPGKFVDEITGVKHLGAKLQKQGIGEAPICCAEDQTPLKQVIYQSVELDLCTTCDGIWLDNGELKKVKKNFPAPKKASHSGSDRYAVFDGIIDGIGQVVVEIIIEGIGALLDGI